MIVGITNKKVQMNLQIQVLKQALPTQIWMIQEYQICLIFLTLKMTMIILKMTKRHMVGHDQLVHET